MGLKEMFFEASGNNPLAKVQIFYFFYDAATKSLSRYLGLYYKHTLLLSPHQVAILLSARSFSLLFGSPVLGSLADKWNKFRNILILCLLAYLVTYIIVPFVEPVDGFNCVSHLKDRQLHHKNITFHHNESSQTQDRFAVRIHKYNSELKPDPIGHHYHGNLMYDLFYTWPLDIWEYLKTDQITRKVFISLLLITLIGEFFASPSETFADVYTLQTLAKDRNKFGLQIIPGQIGWVIISIAFAVISNSNVDLKDDFCHIGHVINYSPYLYVLYAMIFICILLALLFKYNKSQISAGQDTNCCRCSLLVALPVLAKTPAYASFAFVIIFCGIGAGVKQLYIYHYITELGGSLILLPIVTTVHFISNLIALILSPFLLNKYGNVNIIYAGLFTNAVTFIVYAVIERPWLVFLVEPFDGICGHLTWVAIVTYVGSPPKIGAALQGLIHGLYRGLGISLGYLVVSVMILKYGYAALFLALGLIYFVVFGFYLGVMYVYPKRETIAEEHSLYALLFENDDTDDEHDQVVLGEKSPTTYENDKLDTSFLK